MQAVAPELTFSMAEAWHRARVKADVKQEYLAHVMGLSVPQLADQLACRRSHLSLQRVLRLANVAEGRVFLRYLAAELADAAGMDLDSVLMVIRVERVAARLIDRIQKTRPVKAALRDTQQKKEIA